MLFMIKNYFRITWRSLRKNKIYSSINIIGLAVGLAIFWLMGLYIADELSYDRSSPNADRIYRVVHTAEWPTGSFKLAPTSAPFAPALEKDYPEIERTARVDVEGGGTIINGDKKINANNAVFADNSILAMFRWAFIAGDPSTALTNPHSIVLTRTLAENIFGGRAEDALNKTITFQGDEPSHVTGIIEDIADNTHLRFSALRSYTPPKTDEWQAFNLYTYVMLKKGANLHQLETRLAGFYDTYLKSKMGAGIKYNIILQPVPDIHLHSNFNYEISENSDMGRIWLFAGIALLVLIIAVINYINLATARSSIRVREIGVRKVVGAGRGQLLSLFLSESIFYVMLAAAIAVLLMNILMPAFNSLSGKNLSIIRFGVIPTTLALLVFSLLTGLAGGLYPALFLSGFRMIPALKGQQGNLATTIFFRKSLVTFQFVITLFLIAGSTILYMQLHFMQSKDLGFNKAQTLAFHLPGNAARQHIEEFKTQLLGNTSIEAASGASIVLGNNGISSNGFHFEEENGEIAPSSRMVKDYFVDADYLPTMQIDLSAGRNFSSSLPTDKYNSIIVNETLVRSLGWKNPIGKRAQVKIPNGQIVEYKVIGVTKDFNIYSLQHKIEPLILAMPPDLNEEDNLYVRINPKKATQALDHIKAVYKNFDPSSIFEYRFLDQNFARQYAVEERQGRLLLIFTILAIGVACMGLFGLVTFSVGQRTKEIGVRKVLGASVTGIVLLVSKDLIKPVLIGIVISTPITWLALHSWLGNFAYHVNISIWIFLLAGSVAMLLAMITVGWKARNAAHTNPAKSLRTE